MQHDWWTNPDSRTSHQRWLDLLRELQSPFCAADLQRILDWPVRERIELLTLGGLHTKVPDDTWDAFLCDFEKATRSQLPRPFPSKEFLMADDRATRIRILAMILNMNRGTLGKRFLRAEHRLKNLQYIKDLRS